MTNINDSKKISKLISKLMLEKKAYDIKIIYVDGITTLTDIFLVCTSDSDAQSRAITNHIQEGLISHNIKFPQIIAIRHQYFQMRQCQFLMRRIH